MTLFLIGFLIFLIFLCGAAVGAVSALIARRERMAAIDELKTSIARVAADVAALKAGADPTAAVAANQAKNDADILDAKALLDAIDAAPPAPAPAA